MLRSRVLLILGIAGAFLAAEANAGPRERMRRCWDALARLKSHSVELTPRQDYLRALEAHRSLRRRSLEDSRRELEQALERYLRSEAWLEAYRGLDLPSQRAFVELLEAEDSSLRLWLSLPDPERRAVVGLRVEAFANRPLPQLLKLEFKVQDFRQSVRELHSIGSASLVVERARARLDVSLLKLLDLPSLRACTECLTEEGSFTLSANVDPDGVLYSRASLALQVAEDSQLDLSQWTREDRDSLKTYASAVSHTLAQAYEGPNSLLKTQRFRERVEPASEGTLDFFITSSRYKIGSIWWTRAEEAGVFTAESSGSPLRRLYGSDAERRIYWPRLQSSGLSPESVDLNSVRIAVNSAPDARGVMRDQSVEVMARDEEGEWQPYFYVVRDGQLIASPQFMGRPLRESCGQCHAAGPAGAFSPRPQVRRATRESLLESGYRQAIVDALMKY